MGLKTSTWHPFIRPPPVTWAQGERAQGKNLSQLLLLRISRHLLPTQFFVGHENKQTKERTSKITLVYLFRGKKKKKKKLINFTTRQTPKQPANPLSPEATWLRQNDMGD